MLYFPRRMSTAESSPILQADFTLFYIPDLEQLKFPWLRKSSTGRQRTCRSPLLLLAQVLHVKPTRFCSRSFSSPTCVWWSCLDLFGEFVGTSEALIECLEREKEGTLDGYAVHPFRVPTTGGACVGDFLMHLMWDEMETDSKGQGLVGIACFKCLHV